MNVKAQVVRQVGKQFLVKTDLGDFLTVHPRKKASKAVCGDWVEIQSINHQEKIISKVLKRKNILTRIGFRAQVKPIAANLTQICIVCSPSPGFNSELIDRYIIAGLKLNLSICLIFNKSDLLNNNLEQATLAENLKLIYKKLSISFIKSSIYNSKSISQLKLILKNQTSIFAGESGVGKSSLIQQILPTLNLKVGKLSKNTQLGKHTTTHTEIFYLNEGGKLIDSPGVRSFDVSHFNKCDIQNGFEEFRKLSTYCKYNNCTHINEPEEHCQIKQGLKNNKISISRYENYKKIYLFEGNNYSD